MKLDEKLLEEVFRSPTPFLLPSSMHRSVASSLDRPPALRAAAALLPARQQPTAGPRAPRSLSGRRPCVVVRAHRPSAGAPGAP